jgi:hypothetical protein
MSNKRKRTIRMVIFSLVFLALISASAALADGGFDIPWWTVDGGGGQSSGGSYSVMGSVGQADTGTMSGGQYSVNGGFWNAEGAVFPTPLPAGQWIYLPMVIGE